jgi:hypothetical protein
LRWRRDVGQGWRGAGRNCTDLDVRSGIPEPGLILVRDTTNRDGGTLTFTAAAWHAFATRLKRA